MDVSLPHPHTTPHHHYISVGYIQNLLSSTTDVSLMCLSLLDLSPPNTITQTISLVTLNDETE